MKKVIQHHFSVTYQTCYVGFSYFEACLKETGNMRDLFLLDKDECYLYDLKVLTGSWLHLKVSSYKVDTLVVVCYLAK